MNLCLDTSTPDAAWSENNRALLLDGFGRLAARISGESPGDDSPDAPTLAHCAAVFDLSRFERDLLLLLAGLELDNRLRAVLPAPPSFGVAFSLLPEPHWDAMSPEAPLRRWKLIAPSPGIATARAPLAIDERILHFLTGIAAADPVVAAFARATADAADADPHPAAVRACALLSDSPVAAVILHGDAGEAVAVALAASELVGRRLAWLEAADLPADAPALADLARRLDREARLTGLLPLIADPDGSGSALALAGRLEGSFFWLGSATSGLAAQPVSRAVARLEIAPPDAARTCARLVARWRGSRPAPDPDLRVDAALAAAAAQFRLDPAGIEAVVGALRAARPEYRPATVWPAARAAARGGLDACARRIETRVGFDDLALPAGQMALLREIAAQLRNRELVWRDWGLGAKHALGQGLVALFCGESGTGKTLAAEAIAGETGLDLYRVDLSATVSKYIGETEKNLARVFDAAEAGGAVLLFDEADALFGRRSEVRDSHDRYANVEIAYLLQRVEAYRGLAILTTNMKSALDRAFLRRIRFVVPFPFPDAAAREAIWRRQFPSATPLGSVDYRALAWFTLAGGNIRAAAVRAAFKAAAAAAPIDQTLLLEAVREEFAKLERPVPDSARLAS